MKAKVYTLTLLMFFVPSIIYGMELEYTEKLSVKDYTEQFSKAVLLGNVSLAKQLLKNNPGLDIHDSQRNISPLAGACSRKDVEMVRLLVQNGGNVHEVYTQYRIHSFYIFLSRKADDRIQADDVVLEQENVTLADLAAYDSDIVKIIQEGVTTQD